MPPSDSAFSVLLVRLNKESPRKCSLTPLHDSERPGFQWHRVGLGDTVDVGEVTLLHPDGDLLTGDDSQRPLLLVDSSWRDLPRVLRGLRGRLHRRSLPPELRTAYPRKSSLFADPESGLASIEALHAALILLGRRDDSVLNGYHWREKWLDLNGSVLGL